MNETIQKQLSHRSIRAFSDKAVPKEVLDTLLAVANRTATSSGLQLSSIIRVTDAEARRRISLICGQEYVNQAPEFFVFIADCYRNARIAREQGFDGGGIRDMDRFFQAFTDACLAAQNVTTAIESLGLGAVYFGSVLNDPPELIRILALPELTFPVLGLGFGYPAQDPQLKPRMDMSLKVFENHYKVFDNYRENIAAYDLELQTYYDLRDKGRHSASFSEQVVKRFKAVREKRSLLLNVARKQGFDLKLDE
ncbi:MAG: NADPH-dependent oxidoreductase [Candidatus Accumulibacter sp.]|jgi:nitroreductase|nr:NADPH-dependent oxidoreductase [Accumulibacter sp.]